MTPTPTHHDEAVERLAERYPFKTLLDAIRHNGRYAQLQYRHPAPSFVEEGAFDFWITRVLVLDVLEHKLRHLH